MNAAYNLFGVTDFSFFQRSYSEKFLYRLSTINKPICFPMPTNKNQLKFMLSCTLYFYFSFYSVVLKIFYTVSKGIRLSIVKYLRSKKELIIFFYGKVSKLLDWMRFRNTAVTVNPRGGWLGNFSSANRIKFHANSYLTFPEQMQENAVST